MEDSLIKDPRPLGERGLPVLRENSQGAPGGSVKDPGVQVGQEQPATVECTNESW